MTNRLAYLGPPGTYSEQAALDHDNEAVLLPFPSIPAAASAVDSGEADECVVPIENSLQGAVTFTLDLLIHDSMLVIRNELVVPINHCLIVKPGANFDEIKRVYSHPQSLGQCQKFLRKRLPRAESIASMSNAKAVEDMMESSDTAAAIAGERAASLYGGEIIERGIEDLPNNETRFVVLAHSDHPPTGLDKTSICFDFDHDSPGILYSTLGELAGRHINLLKIESRPTKQSLGRYVFLVDIEGHRQDDTVKEALESVKSQVAMFKIFGSYPLHVSSAI